jgi:hypothetical protein
VAGVSSLAVVLCWAGFAGAQAPDPDALFGAARGALEEALGGRLEVVPRFQTITRADLHPIKLTLPAQDREETRTIDAEALKRMAGVELVRQVSWQFPDLKGRRWAEGVAAAAEALWGVSLVLPSPDEGTFLVIPETARQLAQREERLARVNAPEVLQLALVYAVARSALERRYGLAKRWETCRDDEEFVALQAVLEGRALGLTRQLAHRLGTEAYFPLVGECLLHAPDNVPDPLLRLVSQETLHQRYRAGVRGLAFFDLLEAKGLPDLEARVFAHPPRTRDWVVHPDLYLRALQDSRPALADVLQRLQGPVSGAGWQPQQEPWTPAMLRQTAALFGEEARAEGLAGRWLEGRSLVWNAANDPNRQVAVGVIRFVDVEGARAYYGFAADLQRRQDDALGKATGGACRVLESRAGAVTVPGADEGSSTTKRLQFAPEVPPLTVTQFWLRRGDTVLQVSWSGVPSDAGWAERVLQAVTGDGR